jgi:hypothetical protein
MEFCGPTAFVMLPLLFVPFAGYGLVVISCWVCVAVGWGAEIKPWFSYRFVAGLAFCEFVAGAFGIAGNLLTGISLITGEFAHVLIGIACLVICIVFAVLPLNVLAPFRVIYSGGPFLRIRGVHPEYLKELPEFNPNESSDCVHAETGQAAANDD